MDMEIKEVLEDTIEFLIEEVKKNLLKIDDIATKVHNGELGAYEGFMETEKHNVRVLELGKILKEKGLDITQMGL
ncbi:MAG: hypothetical protein OEL19_00750 [Sulfurimonas sp.]|nr:hypothetical protein [Sulfurimonas sp.]